MAEIQDLPRWVWDVVADLIVEEDNHPKLYFTSGAFEGYAEYEWCPRVVLDKVPDEVRAAARVIARYRPPVPDPEPVSEDPEERSAPMARAEDRGRAANVEDFTRRLAVRLVAKHGLSAEEALERTRHPDSAVYVEMFGMVAEMFGMVAEAAEGYFAETQTPGDSEEQR